MRAPDLFWRAAARQFFRSTVGDHDFHAEGGHHVVGAAVSSACQRCGVTRLVAIAQDGGMLVRYLPRAGGPEMTEIPRCTRPVALDVEIVATAWVEVHTEYEGGLE